jgi:hypothetical protein
MKQIRMFYSQENHTEPHFLTRKLGENDVVVMNSLENSHQVQSGKTVKQMNKRTSLIQERYKMIQKQRRTGKLMKLTKSFKMRVLMKSKRTQKN